MTNVRQIIINSPKYGQKIISVDSEDYDKVIKYRWKINKRRHKFYAQAWLHTDKSRNTTIMMHRFVMNVGVGDGFVVDHKDGDGLNNQKQNLRKCTGKENCWNRGVNKNSSTGYRGVTYRKKENRYVARIRVNDELIHLAYSTDAKMAAIAYNKAASKYYGEFAKLNEIH